MSNTRVNYNSRPAFQTPGTRDSALLILFHTRVIWYDWSLLNYQWLIIVWFQLIKIKNEDTLKVDSLKKQDWGSALFFNGSCSNCRKHRLVSVRNYIIWIQQDKNAWIRFQYLWLYLVCRGTIWAVITTYNFRDRLKISAALWESDDEPRPIRLSMSVLPLHSLW